MIAGIHGTLEARGADWAIVKVGGISLQVHMSTSTLSAPSGITSVCVAPSTPGSPGEARRNRRSIGGTGSSMSRAACRMSEAATNSRYGGRAVPTLASTSCAGEA